MNKRYDVIHHIWNSHDNYLGKNQISLEGFDVARFMSNIFCPGPFYYYIIDSPTLTFDQVSSNTEELFGISPADFSLQRLIENIHPDDIEFVMKCEDIVAYFLKNQVTPDKMLNYKISYCIRQKTINRGYRLFLVQTITLKTTKDGALLKVFGSHSDISHITTFNNHKLSFIGLNGEPSYLEIDVFNNQVLNGYKPFELSRNGDSPGFTDRELEIIRLLASGASTNTIAERLHISRHTVETHRKNILRKSKTKSTTEMIVDCIKSGYI